MPTLSVIIPVYNAEPFIGDILRWIDDQEFHDIEVIFVDNNSRHLSNIS